MPTSFFTENNSNESRTTGYSMCCMDYFGVVLHGLMLYALYCVWYGVVRCGKAWQGTVDGMETTMGDTCQAPTPASASAPEFGPALTFPH